MTMADVQFDEEPQYQSALSEEENSFMVRLVFATGLAHDRRTAEYILLGVAIFATIIALYFFFSGSGGSNVPPPLLGPGGRLLP